LYSCVSYNIQAITTPVIRTLKNGDDTPVLVSLCAVHRRIILAYYQATYFSHRDKTTNRQPSASHIF